MPFTMLGLSAPLVSAVSHYPAPTPVQVAAIPPVLSGADVLASAQTGSGKTAAYVLPLLQRWLATEPRTPRALHSLILVPTRELAVQVTESVLRYAEQLPRHIKIVSAFGGVSINPQMQAIGKDPKTELQEWLQGRKMSLPLYRVVGTLGAAHKQTFDVECEVVELNISERGIGGSRRAGEQAAASAMLQTIKAKEKT